MCDRAERRSFLSCLSIDAVVRWLTRRTDFAPANVVDTSVDRRDRNGFWSYRSHRWSGGTFDSCTLPVAAVEHRGGIQDDSHLTGWIPGSHGSVRCLGEVG